MTDYSELLTRVRAGLDGVTEGPWHYDDSLCVFGGTPPKGALHQWKNTVCHVPMTDTVTGLLTKSERDANARFIASARSDVPALADALEAVIAENAALRARVAGLEYSQNPSEQTRTTPDEADAYFKARGDRYPAFLDDWRKTCFDAQTVVDDLFDVMNWLRETNNFAQSDRVRTLAGRLARAVPSYPVFSGWDDPGLIRNLARTYPNQLSPKESKLLLARAEAAEAQSAALRVKKDDDGI